MAKKRSVVEKRDGEDGKVCLNCETWKPLNAFTNSKNGSGGKTTRCAECNRSQKRIYYKENKSEICANNRNRYKKHPEKYKERSRKWFYENREKANKRRQKYYECHKEDELAKRKIYLDLNRERDRSRRKEYYEENREQELIQRRIYYDTNREKISKRKKLYYISNRDVFKLAGSKRKAKKLSVENNLSVAQWLETKEYFGGCALTGDQENLHQDHVIPLSLGIAGNTVRNVIPLRGDLNSSKQSSNIFEWFYKNKERYNLSEDIFKDLIAWLAKKNDMTVLDYTAFVYECFERGESRGY